MQTRRFYAPRQSFHEGMVSLDEGETRHLRDVLRLRAGDSANVFDGEGNEFEGVVERIEKRTSVLRILSTVEPGAPESKLDLTICASVLKGDKTDVAIQKSVELGVNRFIPMITARCDVKSKAVTNRIERWRKIVLEASKQCGRAWLMRVDDVSTFEDQIRDGASGKLMFFSERDGGELPIIEKLTPIAALLGPEGGWDDSEIELARASGAAVITLHGRIMKADTAAIAISAILQHNFGDLN
jgi:16S rRNA (uracil1498-N3)-methyltransferase